MFCHYTYYYAYKEYHIKINVNNVYIIIYRNLSFLLLHTLIFYHNFIKNLYIILYCNLNDYSNIIINLNLYLIYMSKNYWFKI